MYNARLDNSFRNLVDFYGEELLLLEKGYPLREVFPNDLFWTRLCKKGILKLVFVNKGPGNKHGRRVMLSDRASRVSNGLLPEPMSRT